MAKVNRHYGIGWNKKGGHLVVLSTSFKSMKNYISHRVLL
jgi:hypothetical protein